jgi:hypothetical protein
MYKCKYFHIKELVSPKVYTQKGEKAWRFFNPVALQGLDKLREKYGAMTINNSNRHYSGFHLKGEYNRSEYSGHRMWGAFDVLFKDHTAEEVRIDLLGEEPTKNMIYPSIEGFEEITELEYDITWFHVRFCSNIDGVFNFPLLKFFIPNSLCPSCNFF